MLSVGKLLELLAKSGQKLGEVRARLPRYYRAEAQTRCPWEQKGMVMRRLYEETEGLKTEQLDGIKVFLDTGWVLVLPDVAGPVFHVRAESREAEAAEKLVEEYVGRIEGMQEGV